jgi:hypothetical protein
MEYEEKRAISGDGTTIRPTIASRTALGKPPIVDGKATLDCAEAGSKAKLVEKEVELYFRSDYTWLVFFSEPVWLQCVQEEQTGHTYLQVVDYVDEDCDRPLVIRTSLLDACTNGLNQISCREGLGDRLPAESKNRKAYAKMLRQHANYFPGSHTAISYSINDETQEAELTFDWDVQHAQGDCAKGRQNGLRKLEFEEESPDLIMYALPHHLDKLDKSVLPEGTLYCRSSMSGPTCLVKGGSWSIVEDLPQIGLQAPRPPKPHFIPQLADALVEDINYTLPEFFMRGAGDTYFSGKMLAKLARILLIAEEVGGLCGGRDKGDHSADYQRFCNNATLPSTDKVLDAIDRLRSGVEIWISGDAETPFVYDVAWGGIVSCGCQFNGTGCDNRAPDCPAFFDQGLNFGNGKYR